MIKTAEDIILKPIITEASMAMGAQKKYAFKVMSNATKPEIAKAVEDLFKVEVKTVNTMKVHGKRKRVRYVYGYTSDWKKAIVTLKPDSKTIEFFDGMI